MFDAGDTPRHVRSPLAYSFSPMLKLLINGAHGRMGQILIACAKGDPALEVTAAIDVGDDFAAAVPRCDAIVDFSHHSTLELVLARCVEHNKILVIGTTGHSDAQ